MQQAEPAPAVLPDYASWLTTKEIGKKLGVSSIQANAWIVTGIRTDKGRVFLKAVRIGARWRVNPEWVAAFVNAMTAGMLPAAAVHSEPVAELPAMSAKAASQSERERRAAAARTLMRERGQRS